MASIKWLVSLSLLCWVLCLPGEHTHISATSASASSRASSQASSTSIHGKHHFFFDPKPYVFGDPAMDLSDVAMKMNGDSVVQDRWVEKGAVAYNSRDNEYMVVWRADRDVKVSTKWS